jgi:DNA integrity scanning protein DisA with diadenylate cyclase activity
MTEKMESWSMEDLIALTDEIQIAELEYKGKTINLQWCELVESEEPKMAIPSEDTSEDDKNEYYTQLASEKIQKMIEKANEKNPEGVFLNAEVWSKLPTTLKYQVSAKVMGTETDVNF